MGAQASSTAQALFGPVRLGVLSLLFGNVQREFYLREIIRNLRLGQGAVQRELKGLTRAGILSRTARGTNTFYKANQNCPVFDELRQFILKTTGISQVLRAALRTAERGIRLAFLFGSIASGQERSGSDVDLMVVGELEFGQVVRLLSRCQRQINREINPSVFSELEFRRRVTEGDHFLHSVLQGPIVYVLGSRDELSRVAGQRVAEGSQDIEG